MLGDVCTVQLVGSKVSGTMPASALKAVFMGTTADESSEEDDGDDEDVRLDEFEDSGQVNVDLDESDEGESDKIDDSDDESAKKHIDADEAAEDVAVGEKRVVTRQRSRNVVVERPAGRYRPSTFVSARPAAVPFHKRVSSTGMVLGRRGTPTAEDEEDEGNTGSGSLTPSTPVTPATTPLTPVTTMTPSTSTPTPVKSSSKEEAVDKTADGKQYVIAKYPHDNKGKSLPCSIEE